MTKETPFGLGACTSSGQRLYLPLQSVSVNAFIFDVTALVELKQKYTNPSVNGRLTAAKYVFPIPGNAAVCSFKMEDSSGRTVAGVVKETEKAKKEFQEAVDKGKWSGLAHEVTADVFSITIGAIPPEQDVEITLSYSMDIPENESEMMNQIRFALPTFIGQRYGGGPAKLSQPHSSDKGATFSFIASVRLTSNILAITSPSHKSDVVVQETQRIQSGATSLYSTDIHLREPFPLDRDFVLSIQAERLDLPRCIAEVNTADQTVALMLTLVPRLGAPDVDSQEYVFVVDRSGSMGGESRILYARDALKHLMKGLPSKNTSFNIVSFGSHFSALWDKSVVYNRENVAAAIAHIDTMDANMGGTEIGSALDWVSSHRLPNKPTAVIVLTDGEVWRQDVVIDSVSEKVKRSGTTDFLRFFTIGIGNGASVALCSGLARVGNGVCFMTTKSEQIKDRCSKILRAARALPFGNTCDLTVDWGYDTSINPFEPKKDIGLPLELPPHPNVLQAPTQPPNFYPGNRFLVSAILANTLEPPSKVVLKGKLPGGLPVEIPVDVAYVLGDQTRLPLLHTLAARRFIRELEDGDIRAFGINDFGDKSQRKEIAKAAIIEYGVRYKLASRFTAFVAIENGEKAVEEEKDDDAETIADDDDWVKDMGEGSELEERDEMALLLEDRLLALFEVEAHL
ncbi:hypothetical protein SCHPADRAFT_916702 [Schizopora paradoxa]|uniref:VIT-domain-containing protein n=1 Tax=Schizopora paradoxa TaxID=27342 RepID=A0A0H2RBK7_9AGAM|nr:hypothetical protein SCHPADRAFT_916702 [Schizopora paradoxa]